MFSRIVVCLLLVSLTASDEEGISFNGFRGANLSLTGSAVITPEGLLRLTNPAKLQTGHAFFPAPVRFGSSQPGNISSFSSTFAFAIVPENTGIGGHGVAFAISPTKDFHGATGNQYLGLFNISSNGNPANNIFAVELDTIQNMDMADINDNHVGIDINSLRSNKSVTAGYFSDGYLSGFNNLTLISGEPMQVWVEYDGSEMQLNVTLSPMDVAKPRTSLISSHFNLSNLIFETMYVGFSSSTGSFKTSHYILGWNFKVNGKAESLDRSTLPSLPRRSGQKPNSVAIWVPIVVPMSAVAVAGVVVFIVLRRRKFAELLEDWELEFGSQRFLYKDLYKATKGFTERQLLGTGGFGRVYRGVLPASKLEVAVKRVAHESKRGSTEFISEIASIGQLRHRNLVQLLGYCRRKRELLLVYDFMPNGNLDRFLFNHNHPSLTWGQRFRIIRDVASGLLYLHDEWEKTIIHRDVKASNVLLDSDFGGRLGDFGLARLYDHGEDPRTTHVVGTLGYLAPELVRTGRATKATDVFAFGAFLLEVACGKRPLEAQASGEDLVLVGWVLRNWRRGAILESVDARLGGECVVEQAELVLRLGLLCSHHLAATRPSMRQVTQYLDGALPLPELTAFYLDGDVIEFLNKEVHVYRTMSSPPTSSADSLLVDVGRNPKSEMPYSVVDNL